MKNTSSEFYFNKPRKEPGFCDEHGIEHSWEDGEVLTSNPPIYTRYCKNCGAKQHLRPSQWEGSNLTH